MEIPAGPSGSPRASPESPPEELAPTFGQLMASSPHARLHRRGSEKASILTCASGQLAPADAP